MKTKLTHFKPSEFNRNGRNWFGSMCPSLLVRLDVLRNIWGAPIRISPHPLAIGRDDDSNSQHNLKKWGEVRAVDVFYDVPEEKEGGSEFYLSLSFYYLAKKIGFSGIGIYPQWTLNGKRQTGFHLDTGDRKAEWSRIDGKYTDLQAGFSWLAENV